VLAKDETQKDALANVLYHLAETLRILSVVVAPFMPNTPREIRKQLNITDESLFTWENAKKFALLPREVNVTKGPALFPRILAEEKEKP
jgi:methionyl-tRNA synthetase